MIFRNLSACFFDIAFASLSLEYLIPGATRPSTREGKRISDSFRTPSIWDVSVSLSESSPSEASLALSLWFSSSELAKKGLSLSVTGSGALWLLKFALLGMSKEMVDERVASVELLIVWEIVSSKLSLCFISCLATAIRSAFRTAVERQCRIGTKFVASLAVTIELWIAYSKV